MRPEVEEHFQRVVQLEGGLRFIHYPKEEAAVTLGIDTERHIQNRKVRNT